MGSVESSVSGAVHPLVARLARRVEHEINAVDGAQTPERIHQLRVAITRLRTALASFPGVLSARHARALDRNLRWLMRRLASAREWDVFLADVRRAWPAEPAEAGRRFTLESIATRRTQALNRIKRALHGTRAAYLEAELRRLQARQPGSAAGNAKAGSCAIRQLSVDVLNARLRQVRKRGHHFRRLKPGDLHRLRLSLKRLRYASELLADGFPDGDAAAYIELISMLQSDLGRLHDRIVNRALAARIGKRLDQAGRAQTHALRRRLGHPRVGRRLRREWKAFARRSPFWR